MQWGDPWSWSWVRQACPRTGRLPIVLVLAYRQDQILIESGTATLAELGRAHGVVPLGLGRLQPSHTEELVRSVAPVELDAGALATIVGRSDGNPGVAVNLAGAGVARASSVPPSVRAYARARLAML